MAVQKEPSATIMVGTAELYVGMDKAKALDALGPLQPVKMPSAAGDLWRVDVPGIAANLGFTWLQFIDGKLVLVNKPIGYASGKAMSQALHPLFTALRRSGPNDLGVFFVDVSDQILPAQRADENDTRRRSLTLQDARGQGRSAEIVITESIGSDTVPTVEVIEHLNRPNDRTP